MRLLADDSTSEYFDQQVRHPVGPVGEHINTVLTPMLWTSVVVFVGVSAAILYAALRFRRRDDDEEPVQVHGNNRLEIAWTAVPFLVLISIFVLTFVNMTYINNLSPEAKANAVNVCVQGQRFNWSYFYEADCGTKHPGSVAGTVDYSPKGKSTPTALTLVVPVGQPVQLHLVSVDVNHSYFIPQISGQVNAIPGQDNEMWFQIDQKGVFHGACTELCGTNHYAMIVCIDAKPPSDFYQWLNDKRQGKTSSVKVAACSYPPIPQ